LLQQLTFNNDLNKELTDIKSFVGQLEDKGLVENPDLANQRGVKIFNLTNKLAEKRREISDLQAQIEQQKSEKGLTVHGSGVNDLIEKITELEKERIKSQKKSQRSRDELEKTKSAYQDLEKEKNE